MRIESCAGMICPMEGEGLNVLWKLYHKCALAGRGGRWTADDGRQTADAKQQMTDHSPILRIRASYPAGLSVSCRRCQATGVSLLRLR